MSKAQFRILVVLTVVFGFLGGAVSNLVFRGAPALAAGTSAPVQDEVRARKFVLVDEKGRARGTLGTRGFRSFLSLRDEAENPQAMLVGSAYGGAELMLGGPWLRTDIEKNGPRDDPENMMMLNDDVQVRLHACTEGSSLVLRDSANKNRAMLMCSTSQSSENHPESSLTLFKTNGDILWQAP